METNSVQLPSFYAIIPAHVRYCKELEPNAKLLYGELTALCSIEGFCWAGNSHFANLYNVDISTVKRWLTSLKEQNFIKIEIIIEGMQRSRKIWISPEIQKYSTKAQKRADVSSKMSRRELKNEPYINTYSNTEEKREEAQAPAPTFMNFKRLRINEGKFASLLGTYGIEKVEEMMERLDEYADINPKRFKQYACHATVLQKWLRDEKTKPALTKAKTPIVGCGEKSPGEIEAENRTWMLSMEKILFPYIKEGKIYISSNYMGFSSHLFDARQYVTEFEFIETCKSHLKLMGIMV